MQLSSLLISVALPLMSATVLVCDGIALLQRRARRKKTIHDIRNSIAEENRRALPEILKPQDAFKENQNSIWDSMIPVVHPDFSRIDCTCSRENQKAIAGWMFYHIECHESHCKKQQLIIPSERGMDFFANGLIDTATVNEIVSKGV